jgi:hypothetical protein
MKKEKRIPTIIGLILLLITLYFGINLVNQRTNTSSRASGSCEPINPQVTISPITQPLSLSPLQLIVYPIFLCLDEL